ncbi:uncharacterized protein LOC110736767 [Chenopodium quinoa]|nr:uncharacterized protein LOC110736767 [Chenopodium quinoa]
MWISIISGLGAQAIKRLTQGKFVCMPKAPYLNVSSSRVQTLLQLPPQVHRYLCTTATDSCNDKNEVEQTVSVTFVETDGTQKHAKVPVGTSMLEAALSNDIELEGACEGSCACSTCHLIVMDVDYYNKLLDPTDEENDMLDLAFGLTETSRLGCQIEAKPEIDGIRLALPGAT